MRNLYIKELGKVKQELKEQHDKAWAMRYAVKAFIKSLEGFEDKPITKRALQDYYYKSKDKHTRYEIDGDKDYIDFTISGDILNRRTLKIHGFKSYNYDYYNDVALAYELPLYDGETYKTWQDVIDELERRLNVLIMPTYDEAKIEAEYAKCKELADKWNELAKDDNNIWNNVSLSY